MKLKLVTRPRSQTDVDTKVQIATMIDGLKDLPDAAIESGCQSWASRPDDGMWFPTLAELRAEIVQFAPRTRESVPRLEVAPINKRSRARNAWGYSQMQKHMADPSATQDDWQRIQNTIDEMRRNDTVPEGVLECIG